MCPRNVPHLLGKLNCKISRMGKLPNFAYACEKWFSISLYWDITRISILSWYLLFFYMRVLGEGCKDVLDEKYMSDTFHCCQHIFKQTFFHVFFCSMRGKENRYVQKIVNGQREKKCEECKNAIYFGWQSEKWWGIVNVVIYELARWYNNS